MNIGINIKMSHDINMYVHQFLPFLQMYFAWNELGYWRHVSIISNPIMFTCNLCIIAPQPNLSGFFSEVGRTIRCVACGFYCPASRTTLVATSFEWRFCPIIQVPHCIRVFFYFVWFVFINHVKLWTSTSNILEFTYHKIWILSIMFCYMKLLNYLCFHVWKCLGSLS